MIEAYPRGIIPKLLTGVIVLGLLFCLSSPVVANAWSDQNVLIERAEDFLILLDRDDYETAWHEGTSLFMALNPSEAWQTRQQVVRSAYGSLLTRKFKFINYKASYAQSPDGTYVIIQFRSSFINKAESVETVILDCQDAGACGIREYVLR